MVNMIRDGTRKSSNKQAAQCFFPFNYLSDCFQNTRHVPRQNLCYWFLLETPTHQSRTQVWGSQYLIQKPTFIVNQSCFPSHNMLDDCLTMKGTHQQTGIRHTVWKSQKMASFVLWDATEAQHYYWKTIGSELMTQKINIYQDHHVHIQNRSMKRS